MFASNKNETPGKVVITIFDISVIRIVIKIKIKSNEGRLHFINELLYSNQLI